MTADVMRLPLPAPDDRLPLDWFPEDDEPAGLPGVLTETSYTLPDDLSIGRWLQIGETLQRMERSINWWLGDWWNYGERAYGEMASQAAKQRIEDATGHSYKVIQNAGWVAAKFEKSTRVDSLSWTHHRAVADLPPEEARDLLAVAAAEALSTRDLIDRAKERKAVIEVDAALAAPAPERVPPNVRVEVADARSLPLAGDSVHLIITSPPYGVDRPYVGGGDVAAGDWTTFMLDWLTEALRVAAPNGRLALNVPLDTSRGGFRPTYAQAVQMADAAGWTYRSSIVWVDDQLGKSTARGSLDSASAPYVYAGAELVALFSKGEWRREAPCASDIRREEWLEWTNGLWRLVGETNPWEGHPAAFPFDLPRRLVKLLSFPGDTVLDPFCGSGTAVDAARRLGRQAIGFDRATQYVASTLRRLAR
jgi:site-specific DNA-methyltransferase (adenine-specific)